MWVNRKVIGMPHRIWHRFVRLNPLKACRYTRSAEIRCVCTTAPASRRVLAQLTLRKISFQEPNGVRGPRCYRDVLGRDTRESNKQFQ